MNLDINILLVFLSFLLAFIICYVSIPSILTVAWQKNLFDTPEERKAHKTATPTLGGLAIFAGVAIATCLFTTHDFVDVKFILPSLLIIFFVGIKDDILVVAPMTKIGGQAASAIILVIVGNIRITSMHGFYGITEIPYWLSVIISIFLIIVIINGYNLIDGIDGLSSGLGVIGSLTFGIWFLLNKNYNYAIFAFTLVGSLLAFIRFNLFSRKYKIFMGDTGSMLLGLVCAILAIKFNEFNYKNFGEYAINSAPAVTFGIMIVPLFDVLRVMFIRMVLRRGIFQPDKNHIHHKLLDLGFSHKKATFTLLFINVLFIIFVFLAQEFEILRMLLLLLLLGMILSYIPILLLEIKNRKNDEK